MAKKKRPSVKQTYQCKAIKDSDGRILMRYNMNLIPRLIPKSRNVK